MLNAPLSFFLSYTTTVKKLSDVYRDRPMGPMKTAIYWIEYVIRHQGAPHMRSPAKDLNLLQRSSVDVLAFLSVIVFVFVVFLKYLCKGFNKVFKMIFARMLHKEVSKKKVE